MTTIQFIVPETPKGKGRPRFSTRNGVMRTYTPTGTAQFEKLVRLYAKQAMGDRHPFPKEVPVEVRVKAFFPIPTSYTKKKRQACLDGTQKHLHKPDNDNILKAVLDALNKLVFWDDSQVFKFTVEKHYCGEPKGFLYVACKVNEE